MHRRSFLNIVSTSLTLAAAPASPKPNIVLIYADDLGYGDTACYGAATLKTPHIDGLAKRGLRFTDAHTSAATCTPSRYSLLTGEYSFRMQGARVLPGDAPTLIQPGGVTVASMLQQAGYRTGVVGKWHLGLGSGTVNWNAEIAPGPREIGFDESFILPATGDRVPCVYVENGRVRNLDPKDPIKVDYKGPFDDQPTGKSHPQLLKQQPSHGHDMTIVNGISRIGYMSGGKAALWDDDSMADTLTAKAVSFIERNAQKPFFLYFATHDIHVPRSPHPRFSKATKMGRRGNAIAELDWCVGRLVGALKKQGLLANTLIVFSSDNGAVVDDGYQDDAVSKLGSHRPNGPLRGGKYSNFEGGTRVPFIVHWPARIKPGVSAALIGQVDLLRSLAQLTEAKLPSGAAPDSENMLPALLGESKTGRQLLVEQASVLSLRDGSWKYISPGNGPAVQKNTNTEMGNHPQPQLYDLSKDLGETRNLAAENPTKVKELVAKLQAIRAAGPQL